MQYETHMLIVPPPAAHTVPYLIVEQGSDAATVGGRSGVRDPLGGCRPPPPAPTSLTLLLSRVAMLPCWGQEWQWEPPEWSPPPPAAHTSPYLIVEQGGDAAIVGGRRGGSEDPLGGRHLLQLVLFLTYLLSRGAMLP
jgi:hypothetical protein